MSIIEFFQEKENYVYVKIKKKNFYIFLNVFTTKMLKMSALIIFVVLGCLNGLQASEEISLNRPIKSPWNTEQLSTGKFYLFIKQIISFL